MSWSFAQNKIFGSLGESACAAAFQLLGFHVEKMGIEHQAPMMMSQLAVSKHKVSSTYGGSVTKAIRRTPDFLVSRVNANGFTDAMYVEAKFRYCKNRAELVSKQHELQEQLNLYSERDDSVLIFLVTNPMPESDLPDAESSMIWLLFSKNPKNWYPAKKCNWPIYKGNETSLPEIVRDQIDPVLRLILKNVNVQSAYATNVD